MVEALTARNPLHSRRSIIIAPLGVEFSGKSELTRRIKSEFKAESISAGDMVRAAAERNETELDRKCAEILGHGYLKGNEVLQVVSSWFAEPRAAKRIVFDGFFRTLDETIGFVPMLKEYGLDPKLVFIFLRTPVWVPHLRLEAEIEKQKNNTSNRQKRDDDTPEKLLNRMRAYHTGLGSRMSFIKNTHMGEWIQVDTYDKNSDQVFESVRERLSQVI